MVHPVDDLNIEVLYEDGYVLVINKPIGLQSDGEGPSVEAWAKERAKSEQAAHRRKAILLHRLDKPASGILVIAKTVMASKHLQEQMLSHTFKKSYSCLVKGNASSLKGKLEHYLVKDKSSKKSVLASAKDKGAQKAVLFVTKAEYFSNKDITRLDITLQTGRYHQIRSQLSALGFPILGDGLYAPDHWKTYKEIALHAAEIALTHPKSLEPVNWICQPIGQIWNI